MIKTFLALERRVTSAMLGLACLLMALAATLGIYQVLTRFVLSEPSTWSEVGIRMTLIWMVMLGTVAAFRQGALVSVDLLFRLSRGAWRRVLHVLITSVTVAFLAVLVWYGADIAWNFEKFLVGKDGVAVQRFSPKVTPEDPALRAALTKAVG